MNLKQSLIDNDSILLQQDARDWKEAIKLSTDLLVKSGAIEKEYYDAIIDNTINFGPYYIIVPEVAMPHARPEAGVNKDSFNLVTLKEPVYFNEERVSILITLTATTSDNHSEFGIVQVTELFEDDENVESIKKCLTSLTIPILFNHV